MFTEKTLPVAPTLTIKCLSTGQGCFFVDGGRPGYRDRGIVGGGPADPVSAQTANILLGQFSTNCCIETTLQGGRWLLSGKGQMALTGADMSWTLNNEPVDRYRLIYLDGDHLLAGKVAKGTARAYLAVRGEWNLPRVLGSVEAGLPGTVRITQGLSVNITAFSEAPFRSELIIPHPVGPLQLVAAPGPEWSRLSTSLHRWILDSTFAVSALSGRQGIRLLTTAPLPDLGSATMLSSPVLPGTVQLTPSGPILLGPDAQTVGGYPRTLQIDDYGPAFQLLPGRQLAFTYAAPKY